MKKFFQSWEAWFALSLVLASFFIYLTHFFVFQDLHHILIYLVGDIAFVPIEVLLVTLIIHRLLEAKDKKSKLNKMNMVIGTFFHEVGLSLIREIILLDKNNEKLAVSLKVQENWDGKNFIAANKAVEEYHPDFELNHENLERFTSYLLQKRDFLLGLLENPNLLEHDYFTELLWAVFHLIEELQARGTIENYTAEDTAHLTVDLDRSYTRLIKEWIYYLRHLKKEYPYLYVFMVRNNPYQG